MGNYPAPPTLVRNYPAPPPFGFITLAAAVELVTSRVSKGDKDRAITMVAEGCEAGRIIAAYKTITGVDDLDRSVWHAPHWRSYFDHGTIDLDIPFVDISNLKPAADGRTVRGPREIFIRRDSLENFIAELTVANADGQPPTHLGRPSTVDWGAVEDALALEIGRRGMPDHDNEPGWRTRADAQRWVHTLLDDRGEKAGETTVRDHVRKMLTHISQRK